MPYRFFRSYEKELIKFINLSPHPTSFSTCSPFKEDKATSLQLPNSPTPTFEKKNFFPLSLAQWESAICYFKSYLRPKLTVCSLTCTASWKEIYDMILEIHFYVFSVKEVYPIPTLS